MKYIKLFEKVKFNFEVDDLVKFANRKNIYANNIYRVHKIFKSDYNGRIEYEIQSLDGSVVYRASNIRHLTEDEKIELTVKKYNL